MPGPQGAVKQVAAGNLVEETKLVTGHAGENAALAQGLQSLQQPCVEHGEVSMSVGVNVQLHAAESIALVGAEGQAAGLQWLAGIEHGLWVDA